MARILATDERMLGRIGLDIHDGPTQQLSVALLEVQLLGAELDDAEAAGAVLPESLRPGLERVYETLGGALHEMRELIGHLRPARFEGRSLPEVLGDAVTAFEARHGAEVVFERDSEMPEEGTSLSQKITLYRILQEALTNAHRHGHAARVRVRLRRDDAGTTLVVRDDGEGFDAEEVMRARPPGAHPRFGLVGMRDRAQLLGGSFAVESRPGAGTTVTVVLPLWRPSDRSGLGTIAG
jgi:signal transduction histidine kinase